MPLHCLACMAACCCRPAAPPGQHQLGCACSPHCSLAACRSPRPTALPRPPPGGGLPGARHRGSVLEQRNAREPQGALREGACHEGAWQAAAWPPAGWRGKRGALPRKRQGGLAAYLAPLPRAPPAALTRPMHPPAAPAAPQAMLARELTGDPEDTSLRLLYTTPESLAMQPLRCAPHPAAVSCAKGEEQQRGPYCVRGCGRRAASAAACVPPRPRGAAGQGCVRAARPPPDWMAPIVRVRCIKRVFPFGKTLQGGAEGGARVWPALLLW